MLSFRIAFCAVSRNNVVTFLSHFFLSDINSFTFFIAPELNGIADVLMQPPTKGLSYFAFTSSTVGNFISVNLKHTEGHLG